MIRNDTGFRKHVDLLVDNEGEIPEHVEVARNMIGKGYQEKWIYVKGLGFEKDWLYVCGK
jgi:microcompartment protein CcmK/EutM